ncbi:DNA circularization N-terminal domain-containing protein [Falsiroseomonas sp.]|uniref:DNA circularization N-terminal domain-containing protein n=1 Tax=Falsiroseomonas sp. TaxID=2870721 RepID=UPI003F6ED1B5
MSGSLTNPGSLAALIDGLFTSSFRGVEFHIVDARQEAGRRVLTFLFPGLDTVVHEDLGASPTRISITGLIVGEDYVRRAERLDAAFRKPGVATLGHPWLGDIEVVLVEPAQIRFSEKELRVARIDATFVRAPQPLRILDTLGQLLAAIDDVRDQARSLLRRVLAPVRLALGVVSSVTAFVGGAATAWRGAVTGIRGGATLRNAIDAPVTALSGFALNTASNDAGAELASASQAVPDAAMAAATAPATPAIGPGLAAVTTVTAEARQAAELALAAAATMPAAGALSAAATAQALAAACQLTIDIAFESRGAARAWRGGLDAALATAIADGARLAATEPEGAALLLASLHELRRTIVADLDDRIGRLPEVIHVTVPAGGTGAWLVAQHLGGDDPARVAALHRDLVVRNRLQHPAIIAGDTRLEALP